LQSNAYKEYLKEKQFYEKQLEEETRQRLERLRQKETESIQPVVKVAPVLQPKEAKQSKKQILLKYLTLGYYKNE